MHLGKAITWVREQRGMTRQQFADKMGISSATVHSIEVRTIRHREHSMARICKALDVDQEVFFYLTLAFKTKGKLMELGVDIVPLLIHHLKKHYKLDLNETVGI